MEPRPISYVSKNSVFLLVLSSLASHNITRINVFLALPPAAASVCVHIRCHNSATSNRSRTRTRARARIRTRTRTHIRTRARSCARSCCGAINSSRNDIQSTKHMRRSYGNRLGQNANESRSL